MNNRKQLIQKLRKEKKSYYEIGLILGISMQRVHQIFKNYGSIKTTLVRAVKKRDNYQCIICNRKKDLQVHHIRGRDIKDYNNLENLVTLCKSCHLRIDSEDRHYLRTSEPKYQYLR